MMRALLFKDLGILKDTIIAAVALHVFSYIMAALLLLTGDDAVSVGKVLAGGASLSRFTTVLICALVGGHIYGREKEDLSAEFLRQLPVSPRTAFMSKLLVSVGFLSAVWIGSMSILVAGMISMGFSLDANVRVLLVMLEFLSCGAMSFACAWYASYAISSAVGASFVGLACILPVLAAQFAARFKFGAEDGVFLQGSTALIMFIAAGISLVLAYRRFLNQSLGECSRKNGSLLAANEVYQTIEIDRPSARSAFGAVVLKDFLASKMAILLGFCILSLPYCAGAAGAGLLESPIGYFRGASFACIAIGVFVSVFWASNIVTVEHTDKTIDFSSFLPIRGRAVVLSKLLITFVPCLVLVVFNSACLVFTHNSTPGSAVFGADFTWDDWNRSGFLVTGLAFANGTLVAFALSWLIGSRFRRPAPAVVAGIIIVPFWLMVWASTSTMAWETESGLSPAVFLIYFSAASLAVCLAGLALGAKLYQRIDTGQNVKGVLTSDRVRAG